MEPSRHHDMILLWNGPNYLCEYVLDPGGEHDAGDDQGDQQQQPVHDPRAGGVLAAGAERAARRAGRAGEAAGQRGQAQYPAHPGG